MRVSSIFTKNYRNLAEQRVEFCDGVNIICGENGQGKTNLLEAIWLFTGVRSFRGSKNSELIARDGDFSSSQDSSDPDVAAAVKFSRLCLEFTAEGREQSASLVITDKKHATVNGVKLPSVAGLIGKLCAVVFSPDHISLVKGGSTERRKFIDAAIAQQHPAYSRLLIEYNRALAQRNALLRDIRHETTPNKFHGAQEGMLDVWDDVISSDGAKISRRRAEYVSLLEESAARIFSGISSGREELKLRYSCGFLRQSEQEARDALREQLNSRRQSDIAQGFTGSGSHKDDLLMSINGMQVKNYASQGQKRSCVLALKLAEAELLENAMGESPIVIFDDVMSELDAMRQNYLMNHMDGRQVFISCCDPNAIGGLRDGKILFVSNGKMQ